MNEELQELAKSVRDIVVEVDSLEHQMQMVEERLDVVKIAVHKMLLKVARLIASWS